MNPREQCISELKRLGFEPSGGTKHDKYFNPKLRYALTVSRSSHFDEDDKRMILQEAKRAIRKYEAEHREEKEEE